MVWKRGVKNSSATIRSHFGSSLFVPVPGELVSNHPFLRMSEARWQGYFFCLNPARRPVIMPMCHILGMKWGATECSLSPWIGGGLERLPAKKKAMQSSNLYELPLLAKTMSRSKILRQPIWDNLGLQDAHRRSTTADDAYEHPRFDRFSDIFGREYARRRPTTATVQLYTGVPCDLRQFKKANRAT